MKSEMATWQGRVRKRMGGMCLSGDRMNRRGRMRIRKRQMMARAEMRRMRRIHHLPSHSSIVSCDANAALLYMGRCKSDCAYSVPEGLVHLVRVLAIRRHGGMELVVNSVIQGVCDYGG